MACSILNHADLLLGLVERSRKVFDGLRSGNVADPNGTVWVLDLQHLGSIHTRTQMRLGIR